MQHSNHRTAALVASKPARIITSAALAVALTATPMLSPVAAYAASQATQDQLSAAQKKIEDATGAYNDARTKLEDLQKQFAAEGFSVLGFPCNQFLGQEPGSEEEIKTFCSTTYGVTFPLFSKIDVNGEHRAPLYQKLIAAAPKAVAPEGSGFYERMASKGRAPLYVDDILWNFEKFLIDRQGNVIQRFSPDMTPDDPQLVAAIKGALAQ